MSRIDGQEPGMRKGPDTSLNRSDLALMARGISNTKAVKLRAAGYTLGKLQQMNRAALRKVGIDTLAIDNILGDGRPAIPSDKLIEVLCCQPVHLLCLPEPQARRCRSSHPEVGQDSGP
ncbi:hypothetical protein RZR06_21155 [Bradyrhizobium diazoefficiens]|uniref:hypothetical protein n=1 Tax=Bradyrhizobium diazoefficiens TaxID=1355477 RepID=UPI002B45FAEC|nr:hypothetical protein [Bradyrhizobium diazoefficiens]WRJ02585.1 hypothetical protein RZR06_21155 [Bradyrhizobium diazoefficiens]